MLSRISIYRGSQEEIAQLVGRLQKPANEELFRLRAQIAAQLKIIIRSLSIGPLGTKPRFEAEIERLEASRGEGWVQVNRLASLKRKGAQPKRSRRYFSVTFQNGDVRIVYPRDDDPLRFVSQFVANDKVIFETLPPNDALS